MVTLVLAEGHGRYRSSPLLKNNLSIAFYISMYLSIATVCIYLDLFPIGIIPFSLPYLCGRE